MTIDISIVIPVLNERDHLPTCLAALQAQTFERTRYEIIAVDNGSTDGSRDFLARSDGVTVIDEPRRDPYLARNSGASIARGQIIAFTDAHCVVECDWLHQIWQALDQQNARAFVGSLLHATDASYPLRLYGAYHQTKMAYIFEHGLTPNLFCHAGNLALNKNLFDELGGFEALPIPGDTALVRRLAMRSPPVSICYRGDVSVRRQSSRTLIGMWRKTAEHAKYNAKLSPDNNGQTSFSTLSSTQRRSVFRTCQQRLNLSWMDTLILGGVLLIGSLIYETAQLRMPRAKA